LVYAGAGRKFALTYNTPLTTPYPMSYSGQI
jgi:hypothetical protein